MKRKELIALLIVGVLLSGLITATASEAGSATNPLISLEWLQNVFLPVAEESIDNAVDNGVKDLFKDTIDAGASGTEIRVKRGDILLLESGATLTALAGDLSASTSGTILDVTQGNELPSSSGSILVGSRYLTAEKTQAFFTVTSDTAVVRLTGLCKLTPSRETDYNALEDALHAIGVFAGSPTPYGSGYDLEQAPTRIQGLIMFLRLLGEEEAALSFTDETVVFRDVPAWARPYVAYAYSKGYTKGQEIDDQGRVAFGPNELMAPRDYMTFILRALGYTEGTDFKWKHAVANARELGVLTEGEEVLLTEKPFLRAQVVYLSYFALSNKLAGQESTLLDRLLASQAVDQTVVSTVMGKTAVDRL